MSAKAFGAITFLLAILGANFFAWAVDGISRSDEVDPRRGRLADVLNPGRLPWSGYLMLMTACLLALMFGLRALAGMGHVPALSVAAILIVVPFPATALLTSLVRAFFPIGWDSRKVPEPRKLIGEICWIEHGGIGEGQVVEALVHSCDLRDRLKVRSADGTPIPATGPQHSTRCYVKSVDEDRVLSVMPIPQAA